MNSLSAFVFLVAMAVASASVLAGPGLLNTGALIGPGLLGARGVAIGGPLGLGLAGPLGLGGVGIGGIGIGGVGIAAAPLGVRVTAQNLRVAPAGSPIGVLVPAGNGLEGAYVPDISEKLSDDGSWKPEIYGA